MLGGFSSAEAQIDVARTDASRSLIDKISSALSDGIHLVSRLKWDICNSPFLKSLHVILNQFMYAATCLKLVEILINKVEKSVRQSPPTLKAFACSISTWLKRLRDVALKEETKISNSNIGTTPTLLGLASGLSSLCSGAEYLLQVVHGAIPQIYFEPNSSVPAAEMATHILDHLYKKLNEVCHMQGGEEEAYQMLLFVFVGSLLPYIEGLDSWLYEGTLDDPCNEMFFYANKTISIDEAEFWEKSYLLRPLQSLDVELSAMIGTSSRLPSTNDKKEMAGRESISTSSSMKGKEQSSKDLKLCPLFVEDIAKPIISAGKSLQLIRHVPMMTSAPSGRKNVHEINGFGNSSGQSIAGLTLSEIFCVSLVGLIGHGDHISKYFWLEDPCNPKIFSLFESHMDKQNLEKGNGESLPNLACSEKIWFKFLVETLLQKGEIDFGSKHKNANDFHDVKEETIAGGALDELLLRSSCPENPVITMCKLFLNKNRDAWSTLNLSRNFYLPPLNDEGLREAIFGEKIGLGSSAKGTDYAFAFKFAESEYLRSKDDTKLLEELFPFPTLLPSFQENLQMSELLPFQKNSTLSSRVLTWLQSVELKVVPLPVVIMQECLIVYIKKQVDYIGRHILSKLMNDWRLMDELGVLRAIYLLGSGDLLQHFLTVLFNKLDKGESWDDDFELNTILQESIRNSADGMLLTRQIHCNIIQLLLSLPSRSRESFGIDGLDLLKFTYKVSWPLELIANTEAIKKYNQVMGFLLKVKRAKFVLDKARRWMWKGRGTATINRKHHWLVEQNSCILWMLFTNIRGYFAWREEVDGIKNGDFLVKSLYRTMQRDLVFFPSKLYGTLKARNSIAFEDCELSIQKLKASFVYFCFITFSYGHLPTISFTFNLPISPISSIICPMYINSIMI
ncbi:hypothetical protein AAG906_030956 [Vitis piasezkii]